jgi:hypothetical protein
MLTEDYLMRIINQALAALLKVAGLKKSGRNQEALQVIDQAFEQLLGLPASLVRAMDECSILTMHTTQGEMDVERLAIIADLSREEGDILNNLNRPAESFSASSRALRFYLEVASAGVDRISPETIAKIEDIYRKLRNQGFPPEIQSALLDFYQSLFNKDRKELTATGISRKQIEEAISDLSNQSGR